MFSLFGIVSHTGDKAMPLYKYKCISCEHQFEAQNTIADRETAPCPECGGQGRQEIRTMTAFELKGEGWPGKKAKGYSTARGK